MFKVLILFLLLNEYATWLFSYSFITIVFKSIAIIYLKVHVINFKLRYMTVINVHVIVLFV
jgi:hypothetical protein